VKVTSVFSKNILAFQDNARYIVNQGGTSSSKTYSILQLLILIAARRKGLHISVVSESLPHLKRGALRDFTNILTAEGLYSDTMHNKSNNTFTIGQSTIEFFSADVSSKLRGARRDILFINECNNITYSSFQELAIRTKLCTFLDYNPVSEFWVHTELLNDATRKIDFIKSTYRDNELLDKNILADIESRKERDPNWWKVYGEGEIGNLQGVIFSNHKIVSSVPDSPKQIIGIDFGFSNDPTSIVLITYSDGELYWDEICYATHMTNGDIARVILSDENLKKCVCVCDSAEPKSIHELQLSGVRAIPAEKGADSVRSGIDILLQQSINITQRSVNTIKEFRNYRWKVDKDGKSLNVPVDIWNHCIDAGRYASVYLLSKTTNKVKNKVHVLK
jgi:phage terminase large subunit